MNDIKLSGQHSRSQPPGSKTRGKVTFWNDLEATYFQKLEQEKVEELFSNLKQQEVEKDLGLFIDPQVIEN